MCGVRSVHRHLATTCLLALLYLLELRDGQSDALKPFFPLHCICCKLPKTLEDNAISVSAAPNYAGSRGHIVCAVYEDELIENMSPSSASLSCA